MASRAAPLAFAVATVVAACGGNVVVDPASGNGGAPITSSSSSSSSSSSTTTTTSSSSSSSTTTTSSSSSSTTSTSGFVCPTQPVSPPSPCSPKPSCASFKSPCLAEVSQAGQPVFGLRMAHLTFFSPKAFTQGIVSTTLQGNVTPDDKACNLLGAGTFSWLLQFDPQNGIVTTGGAKPSMSPGGPYQFVKEVVALPGGGSVQVAPTVLKLFSPGNCAIDSTPGDLVMPIYLNDTGTSAVYLPLHQLVFAKGSYSADQSCIGFYNASGLDASNACQPTQNQEQFVDGGLINAFMTLAEADTIPVAAIGQSLCVLISGNATMYGDGGVPIAHCKKTAGNQILFQGDWCSTTNGPATSTCHDAVQVAATFAASGVKIN